MKRIICFLICITMLFSLCGCGSKYGIEVDSIDVSDDIYDYYMCQVRNGSEYQLVNDKKGAARMLCAKYVAVNEMVEMYGISLSAEKSVAVANDTKVKWQLFSKFYEKYDVSKQTLGAILETEALVDTLVLELYGENGIKALQESEVKKYFNGNFVAVKVISTDFNENMDEKAVEDISQKYVQMRNIIDGGGEFSSAAQHYPELARYEDNDTLITSFDTAYPDGFFKKVAEIKSGDTKILRYSSGIYLVQKSDNTPFYDIYKENCIIKMKKGELLKEIETLAKSYKISYK